MINTNNPTAFIPEQPARQRKRHWLLGINATLLIVAVAAWVFVYFSVFAQFTTIMYDNGTGTQFRLSFYWNYSQERFVDSLSEDYDYDEEFSKMDGLFSHVSKKGKLPLTLIIYSSPKAATPEEKADSEKQNLHSCHSSSTQAVVYNKHIKDKIYICGNDDLQIAIFRYQQKSYIAVFGQSVKEQFGELANLPDDASEQEIERALKEQKATSGINVYQEDINKIVASIQPLD